ncbi:MAG: 2-oxoacid:acceptor oxidoreductase subunit alpha [Candidatus Brocadiia bacterium]
MHFIQGNEACVLGAMAAGCRFYAGYPITPSSEIMEHMAAKLPDAGGVFIQMEDEIGSIGAVIGASWAGAKSMTATSGPGLSLMIENIGYAIMTETPCVIVDVQRAGPSTGQATKVASGDVMQVRWGAHGDYEIIALSPWSAQEMYDLVIRAFNLAETYRIPVFLLADEAVGHIRENVNPHKKFRIITRPVKSKMPPFGTIAGNKVTPMPRFGQGLKLSVTGSTHDEWGYRRTQSPAAQTKLVERFCNKIKDNADKIIDYQEYFIQPDTEILLIAYGITARSALRAVEQARESGIKAGLLRLRTLWPMPEKRFAAIASRVKRIIVPELNQGQLIREVQRFTGIPTIPMNKTSGEVITANEIFEVINNNAR